MPKKAINVSNFSGGLNNNTSPRDLADNEFQVLLNLSNEVPGKLKVIGDEFNLTANALNAIDTLNYGNGLLHYNADRNLSSPATITETEYLLINNITASPKRVSILDCNSNGHVLENDEISYGDTAAKVEMYNIDGAVRVVPHFGSSVGTNKPKVFSYYKFIRRLGGSNTAIDHEDTGSFSTNDLYIAPIRGRSNVDKFKPDEMYNSLADGFTNGFHTPGNGSEVFMFPANSDSTNPERFGLTATAAEQILDDWDDSVVGSNPYTDSTEGSMGVFIGFSGDNAADTGSNIDVITGTRYVLFASKVYKDFNGNKQESESIHIGHIHQNASSNKKQNLYFGLLGRMGGREKNYSGFKLYWAHVTDINIASGADGEINTGTLGPKYLFAEVDFEEGVRYAGSNSYSLLNTVTINSEEQFEYPSNLYSSSLYAQPFEITELKTVEPSLIDKGSVIGPVNTGFKTSTIINRRLYVGNVQYENADGEIVTKSDRVLKSLPNQFDFFEEESFIDAAIEDGDSIIKLSSVGNKLLQFKKRNLFIINVSRNIEFLEASFNFKGCEKDYHVVQGEGFVAWFNKYGAFIYDGQRIVDININENGQSVFDDWESNYYHDNNVIGFIPKTKQVYITNNQSANNVLMYDIKSQSWFIGDTTNTNDISNIITRNNGDINWVEIQSNDAKLVKWVNSPTSFTKTGVIMQSKEYDFGTPMVNKNINTIYINCKQTANITLQGFGTKRNNTPVPLTDIPDTANQSGDTLSNTTNSFKTLKLAVPDTFKNLVSFGIALKSTGAVNAGFEINDIQIVYREKAVR
tara:strand:- start:5987 stop:8398 length:2412 start_codon:yes stop_codon:yes gene_type:complete